MADNDRWLLAHAGNRHSQFGEDGIIAKVLDTLGEPGGWCVEFGAWDGRHLSNTCALIEERGYSAVLIEGDRQKFVDLEKSFSNNPRVVPVCAFVGFGDSDGLDGILARTPIPEDFAVLSIDIDGNDYHVWDAMRRYRPRVVVIEFNPTIPTAVDFVQPADPRVNQGSSLRALVRLGQQKGYELVAATDCNGIFVRREDFARFRIEDNSPEKLRPNESLVTWIFCGYDGRVFVRGHGEMPWHRVPYAESRMQRVAGIFRTFPSNFGKLRKLLYKPYRSLKKRRRR